MTPTEGTKAISQWKLERYLLEELPRHEMEQIREALEQDASLSERLEALRMSNDDVLEKYPAAWMARRIEQRAHTAQAARGKRGWLAQLWPAPAALAVAVAAIVPLLDPQERAEEVVDGPSLIRAKGLEPHLIMHRKTESGAELLESAAAVEKGDLIQIQYVAAGRGYGAIVSIDGRGRVTTHLPATGGEAVALTKTGAVSLPFALELDDAPRRERFYFVTSRAPFSMSTVIAAAQRLVSAEVEGSGGSDSLSVPTLLEQSVFVLTKNRRVSER